jgi:hypothetical protein
MKRGLLSVIAGLAILGLSTAASAASVDLGDISAGDSNGSSLFYSDSGLAVTDTWSFTLTESLLTAIVVDSADFAPFFGIANFNVSSGNIGAFAYDASDNSWSFSGQLAAGDYSFDVSGTTSGALGGEYEVLVGGVTPVPLPPAFWLMATALVALRRATKRQ